MEMSVSDLRWLVEFVRVSMAVVHVAAGVVCLGVGSYLAMARKGTRLHQQLGRIYFRGMMIVCATGVVMAVNSRNYVLLVIAIFSGYLALAGYRAQKIRREGRYRWIDHTATWTMLVVGLGMVVWGATLGSVVLVVFGGIGSAMAAGDTLKALAHKALAHKALARQRRSPAAMPGSVAAGQTRMLERRHRIMMASSLIALWTAFLVNNVSLEPAWALWLLPTVIGSAAIALSLRQQPA